VTTPDEQLDLTPRRRTRWGYAVLSAAVVAGVAAALALLPRGHADSARPQPLAPPPGTKAVSYHGITIDVPKQLPVQTYPCGPPSVSHVQIEDPGLVARCAAPIRGTPAPTAALVVTLAPAAGFKQPIPSSSWQVSTRTIAGNTARVGLGRLAGRPGVSGELVLDRPGVALSVTAGSRSIVSEILRTTRVTPVDAVGCQSTRASFAPADNSQAPSLVPGTPTSAILCSYDRGLSQQKAVWLMGSARLPATVVRRVAGALSVLPPGPAHGTGLYIPDPDWIVFSYADGTTRTVAVERNIFPSDVTDGHLVANTDDTTVVDLLDGVR
jgi:hypothetical protein